MDKGKIFRDLHASTFVMPNPWDPGTTKPVSYTHLTLPTNREV